MRHLEKFRGIWKSFEGFGKVSRDLKKFILLLFTEVMRDLEKFRGIWRSFEGFEEVSRDLEKFRGIVTFYKK